MMEGDSLPRPARFRGPRYPFKLLGARAVDELVAAFVVDTAGRVEKSSITFVQPPSHREFQESVCKFLQDEATFIPGQTNGRARRTLVFMPFAFTLNFDAPSGPAPDVKGMQEHARAAPRDQLVAELENRPHC